MTNILCHCATYAQFLMAVQLKNTCKRTDRVFVCLTDHSANMDQVAARTRELGYFDGVLYWPCRALDNGNYSRIRKLEDAYRIFSGSLPREVGFPEDVVFDELIYYNLSVSSSILFAKCRKKNRNLTVSRYEEGILSYGIHKHNRLEGRAPRLRLGYGLRRLLGSANITDDLNSFYCYHPDLYHGSLTPVRVPFFTDRDCRQILADIFQIPPVLNYPQKYIYFASMGDVEGGEPVGELALALKIADLVGRDNLLVKVHPRDKTGAFENAGLLVDARSAVPWEVIQLNGDFRSHVFLTLFSGSVLGASMMTSDRPRICLLYNLCPVEKNSIAAQGTANLKQLLREMGDAASGICVPDVLEEILN